jgi:transposase-like protein
MAKAESLTLIEFQQKFNNEEACAAYLIEQRWKHGFKCPACKHHLYYYIQSRQLYECQQCHKQTSITAGTIMHQTKLSLMKWFWAIYLFTHDKRGHSALALSVKLKINYRTASRLLSKIREAMKQQDAHYKLSGLVEMDDGYFGAPQKGKAGRGTTKAKVVVALSKDQEDKPKYLRMQVIESVSIEEIHRVANQCIAKGATILSDGHSSYKHLKNIGYQHESKVYYKEDKEDFLKYLHKIISNAKAFIQGTYHGLGQKYLQTYLDEFCYRFNRRYFPNELYGRMINACLFASPINCTEPSA